jgi:uncharacterized MAPEG superfamily protein
VSLSHWALLGFVAWMLLLVIVGIGAPRISAVLKRQARPNAFNPDVPHGSERYQRTMRAHLNCVENLPVFAALVLLGTQLAVQGELFQTVAFAVLPARVLQSTVHIASGRSRAALARFTFFSIQLCCFALLIGLLVAHGFRAD